MVISADELDETLQIEKRIKDTIINTNYDKISKESNNKSSLDSFKNNIYKSYLSLEIGEIFLISTLFNKKLVSGNSLKIIKTNITSINANNPRCNRNCLIEFFIII